MRSRRRVWSLSTDCALHLFSYSGAQVAVGKPYEFHRGRELVPIGVKEAVERELAYSFVDVGNGVGTPKKQPFINDCITQPDNFPVYVAKPIRLSWSGPEPWDISAGSIDNRRDSKVGRRHQSRQGEVHWWCPCHALQWLVALIEIHCMIMIIFLLLPRFQSPFLTSSRAFGQ